ncbi:hypothetical protein MSPP1_000860 [Malassezia sp. CBS 17886]|nr:hypothetical protein MSPP1_000860 [Malassezia sp. CBS 17886]
MSWRSNAQITGMNAQPLGATRRWGPPRAEPEKPPPEPPKRRADEGPPPHPRDTGDASERADGPTTIAANVSGRDLDRYAIQVRLEEINQKMRVGDVVPPERERSPSPPPMYDGFGRRTNTRDVRYRKRLDEERVQIVEKLMRIDPTYRPTMEYHTSKRHTRPTEKVYLPVREFPEINFFGLLVGPRGNTLKKMEGQSGAKIHIRGRGSVKHGKGNGEEDEEDMHCIVTADSERSIKLCLRLINEVVATAASTPETQNDHKRNQLRELAVLNGTLRDDENQVCQNCGEKGHRKFECPQERNWTASIVCHRCGGHGHLARDCMGNGGDFSGFGPGGPMGPPAPQAQVDPEYANLMAELGENPNARPVQPGFPSGPLLNERGEKIPPWRDPNVWNTPGPSRGGAGAFMDFGMDQGWGGRAAGNWAQDPNAYAQMGQEGQQDYSAEWAAYYAAQATAQQQGQDPAAPASGDAQKDYSKEWEEYVTRIARAYQRYYRQQALAAQQGQQPAQVQ